MTTTQTSKSIHTGNCEKCGAWSSDLYRPTKIDRKGTERFVGRLACSDCRNAK